MVQQVRALVALAGLRFNSQAPYGGSQPPVSPVPGDPTGTVLLHIMEKQTNKR